MELTIDEQTRDVEVEKRASAPPAAALMPAGARVVVTRWA
jgi:hypothetical protein